MEQVESFELGRILGLIEGEGYFSIGMHRKANHFVMGPLFGISLCEERKVLIEIQESFKMFGVNGAVIFNSKGNDPTRKQDQWKFQIHGIQDALTLVEMLAPLKWVTKKRHTFDVWSEVVRRILAGEHYNRDGFIKIVELWDGAKTTKGYTRKYTAEYFRELWKEPWKTRPWKRLPPPSEVLREMYFEKKMSIRAMYRRLGCGHGTMYRWLKNAGIQLREKSEAVSLARSAGRRSRGSSRSA